MGTPHVESLSSYIGRLALAHLVTTGTLLTKVVAPMIEMPYLSASGIKGGSRFYESSGAINGIGQVARSFVTALEYLTFRNDLRYTTMLPWSELLPSRGLMKSKRAWCPICLQEQKFSQKIVYEPLIWSIQEVNLCHDHECRLETICPTCGKENYVLSRRYIPGYCSKCANWLGLSSGTKMQNEPQYSNWVTDNTGKLLSTSVSERSKITAKDLGERFSALIEHIANGNVAMFARILNLPKVSVWSWAKGKNRPTLGDLMKMGFSLRMPIDELLYGESIPEKVATSKKTDQILPPRNKKKPLDKNWLRNQLQAIIESKETPSMRKVSRQLKVNRRIIYEHFPEISKKISSAYLAALEESRIKRLNHLSSQVEIATRELWAIGIYPSRRAIETYTGVSSILREAEVQKVWKNTIDTLDLPDTKDSLTDDAYII